jgi:hypothetical protein
LRINPNVGKKIDEFCTPIGGKESTDWQINLLYSPNARDCADVLVRIRQFRKEIYDYHFLHHCSEEVLCANQWSDCSSSCSYEKNEQHDEEEKIEDEQA